MQNYAQKITLTNDARWLHDGVEITHERTLELFFKSVFYNDGHYFLTGEKMPVSIAVEDVAYFVKSIKQNSDSVVLTLSNQQTEVLDCTTLDLRENNELICRLKNGAPAKFERKVYNELMKDLVKKSGYLGLVIGTVFYPLGLASEAATIKSNGVSKIVTKRMPENTKSKTQKSPAPAKSKVKSKEKTKSKASSKAKVKKPISKTKAKPKTKPKGKK